MLPLPTMSGADHAGAAPLQAPAGIKKAGSGLLHLRRGLPAMVKWPRLLSSAANFALANIMSVDDFNFGPGKFRLAERTAARWNLGRCLHSEEYEFRREGR